MRRITLNYDTQSTLVCKHFSGTHSRLTDIKLMQRGKNDRQVPLEKMKSKFTVMEGRETLRIVVNQEGWWWSHSVGKVLFIYLCFYLINRLFIVFLVYFVPLFIQEESALLSFVSWTSSLIWLTTLSLCSWGLPFYFNSIWIIWAC